jgi:hypothetical protein
MLAAVSGGDPEAAKQLAGLVYDQLRQRAEALMKREAAGHTARRATRTGGMDPPSSPSSSAWSFEDLGPEESSPRRATTGGQRDVRG